MNSKIYEQMLNHPQLSPKLGQILLRDDLLTEILGDESHEILYWAGKRLGRKYRLQSLDDVITFFDQFGFGELVLTKQAKSQLDFTLSGEIVKNRLTANDNVDFQLECGLLAQLIEFIENRQSESEITKQNAKKGVISIRVSSSTEPPIDDLVPDKIFEIINPSSDNHE